MGGEKVEKLGENICGRGVGKRGGIIYGSSPFGDARHASLRDMGWSCLIVSQFLFLIFHLSTLISHLNSLQERFFIHDFYAEFLRLFEF